MLLQKTIIALTLALACESSIIPEVGYGLVARQNGFGGNNNAANNGGNKGGNGGNNGAAAAASAAAAKASASAAASKANNGGGNGGNNNAAAAATCLNAKAVQTGSASDGNQTPADGQAASATDTANFINFCSGQTLTNGLQVKQGSCNGIVMGKIPSTANMISGIITSPKPGENIAANKDFTISIQTKGLTAGSFTNAAATYYSAPQDLASNGQVIGHTHLTVQDLGNSLQPTTAPDPTAFVFFKGVNDAGNNKGLLSATVTGGLPAGNYRVCSMTSSSNHQPVLMPVAQRGAQDDCQKFTVGAAAGGNTNGNAANANNGGNAKTGGKAKSRRFIE
ncbi:uncharacterized protein LY89DRAFT_144489 [Mollisia scopiformis]|uniref:Ribosomal protein s17 n=1 Tax=Mollisia scopiformis TaxID=149040 RepID=A0A194X0D2_MOLSC|nr:uncharacterized protein LY89DRAFT_144489 [Mollisia scopiformis]KUJ13648.1 hypothetical protein LY89DRAFT_144489 [Mollisia scopiformis]